MSQPLEQCAKAKKASHEESEDTSNSDSESEEGSTASEEDTFLSIWYPSLPYLPTAYLCNQDFSSSEEALRYIMKHFKLEMIQESVKDFPNLSKNFIYSNNYVDPDCFTLLK